MIPDRFVQRFMEKVAILDNGCWIWNRKGCPQMAINRQSVPATHISWLMSGGELPTRRGWRFRRMCANPRCVNAEHLFVSNYGDSSPYSEQGNILEVLRAQDDTLR